MAESKVDQLYNWVDERTGIKKLSAEALDEPIRGGAKFAYFANCTNPRKVRRK